MDTNAPPPELTEAPIILDRSRHPISRRDIDADALKVLYRLHKYGHTAYLVGGAVRDLMLGKKPADFDISTDAHPNRIKKLFANAFLIGRRFRLAHIRFSGGKIIEVSTFRKKPEDGDEEEDAGRAENGAAAGESAESATLSAEELDPETTGPASGAAAAEGGEENVPGPPAAASKVRKPIAFGTPREDAFRRDITINALFYDIATFSVIDYVGGLEDLAARRVRIIGDPDVSYTEDPVRIWRVLRHAARLGFTIEAETESAIARHRDRLTSVAGSRLFEEMNKDFKSGAAGPLFELMRRQDLLPLVLGGIGAHFARSEDHFTGLAEGLSLIDRAARAGSVLSLRIQYSLFFWPWAKTVLAGGQGGDKPKILFEAAREAKPAVLFPRGLLVDVCHTLVIVEAMLQALKTGHMRWSLRKRSQYADASPVVSLLVKGAVGEGPDPFEGLMREKFPSAATPSPRRKRRRRRRRPPSEEPKTP